MTRNLELIANRSGVRLDKYVAEDCPELSRSYIQKLIGNGHVTVNNCAAKGSLKLNVGDRIVMVIPPPAASIPLPEEIPLTIVYEDNYLLFQSGREGVVLRKND